MQRMDLVLVLAMVLLFSNHRPVEAYLDPGTGSIVLQAVIAGVVGALAAVKLYWSRLKKVFGRDSAREKRDN